MESSSLQNWKWKRKRYKEEDGVVPTSPSTPPSSPNRVARAPKCPRSVSPRENRRKRANLTHQRKLPPGGSLSPPGASHQTVLKLCVYCPAVSRCRQAVSCWKGHFRMVGAWRLALEEGVAWRCLCGARRLLFLPHLMSFCLLLATHDHSLVWIFGTFPSTKRTQKWGLVVYLDQCNPKCIYLQK